MIKKSHLNKRGLASSGGGAKGDFIIGVLSVISDPDYFPYRVIATNSTSTLIIPFLVHDRLDKAKELYNEATNKSIYRYDPINRNSKFRLLRFLLTLSVNIFRRDYLVNHNLHSFLLKGLKQIDFKYKHASYPQMYAAVTNYTKKRLEFFELHTQSKHSFIKKAIASASVPILFPPIKIKGNYYYDGGIIESVPIQKLIDEGCNQIDIIISSPENEVIKSWKPKGLISIILQTIKILFGNIQKDDIKVGILAAKNSDVVLNFYYTPYKLTDNAMDFDNPKRKEWYDLGVEAAKHPKIINIKKNEKRKI